MLRGTKLANACSGTDSMDLFLLMLSFWSRFWWSLLVGVDWWDAVGCTQSAAEDGIGKQHYLLLFFGLSANDIFLTIFILHYRLCLSGTCF